VTRGQAAFKSRILKDHQSRDSRATGGPQISAVT